MRKTPLKELARRIQKLKHRLRQAALNGALLTQNVDLFYFGGSMQQGFLFVPVDKDPLYMVRRNFDRAREESHMQNILPLNGLKQLYEYLNGYVDTEFQKIGLELDILPVNNYQQLQRVFPGVEFVDISSIIREIRAIKSDYEIDCFRQAAEIALDIYQKIPALLEVGKPEIILASELETLYRRAGHQGILRMRGFNAEMLFGHVYSGENGALSTFLDSCTGGQGVTPACPQGAGWRTLKANEPIGLDYGSMYGGYVLDHTRVFSIGPLPTELEKAYDIALQIQDSVTANAFPGALCGDLYSLAVEIACSHGLGDFFMGYNNGQVKFIGHGVGLDLDEFPILSQGSTHILQPGMVFALEPKFVFPRKGMVGLENIWLVTEKGLEKISNIPDKLVTVPHSAT